MAKSLHRFGKFCAIISFNKLFDLFSFFSLWDSNNSHIFFLWYPKKHTGFSLSLFVLLWLDNFKVSALHFKDSFFWLIHSAVDGFTSFIVFFSFRISVYYDFCVFVNFSFLFLYCFYWFCSIILLFPLSFLEIAIWNSFFFCVNCRTSCLQGWLLKNCYEPLMILFFLEFSRYFNSCVAVISSSFYWWTSGEKYLLSALLGVVSQIFCGCAAFRFLAPLFGRILKLVCFFSILQKHQTGCWKPPFCFPKGGT